MSELPADLRSALPPLVVNGSVYAGQAAERLLILNGQPLHEGDTVALDLVLEQIQLQSAVLNLRGTRFSLPF
jgi:general secretion pathway protein B